MEIVEAPLGVKRRTSAELIGKPYALKGGESELGRFSCWSLVWHYEKMSGLLLPYDPFEAQHEFLEIKSKPQWRDILTYKPVRETINHLGVAESHWSVVHSCSAFGSVERSETIYEPWSSARIFRHKSLL